MIDFRIVENQFYFENQYKYQEEFRSNSQLLTLQMK